LSAMRASSGIHPVGPHPEHQQARQSLCALSFHIPRAGRYPHLCRPAPLAPFGSIAALCGEHPSLLTVRWSTVLARGEDKILGASQETNARGRREATETLNLWSREVGCRFLEAAALARVLNRWPKGPPSRCTPAFRSESPSCGLSARRQLFGLGILKLRGRSLISLIIQTELVLLCTFRTAAGRLGNVWRL